jgi:HEAT repeat protein
MRLFGKKPKDERSRLLELVERWRRFETVELNQPHLERKLREFTSQLDQHAATCREVLQAAGKQGSAADADFLFEVLIGLPPAPEKGAVLPGDPGLTWERAEAELGRIARVVNGIRVPIQQQIRQAWQKNLAACEKRASTDAGRAELRQQEPQAQLEAARQAERKELGGVDQEFRRYLSSLSRLHELYAIGFDALAGVEGRDGLQEIVETLRSPDQVYRNLAMKALERRNWSPTTVHEKLDFHIVQAKLPENEAEGLRKLTELIRATTEVRELTGTIEPRLAEEGLTELQGLLLEQLCDLHSAEALDRLAALMASSLEPPALKVKVARALPDIGTPRAVQLLITAMDELDMEVRAAAAEALGRVGPTQDASRMTDDAGTRTAEASGAMREAYGVTRQSAMERLVFALRDGDVLVRETAAKALKHYPEAAERLLCALTGDRNPNAREYAARALSSFAPGPASGEALIKALQDEDSAVRKAAAEALAKQEQVPTDPESKIRFLCAKQNWKELRRLGLAGASPHPVAPCLIPLLHDRSEEIRLAIVELLGAIRAPGAVSALGVSLSDSSQHVRRSTAIALRLINDPAALDPLRTALAKEGFKDVKAEIEQAIRKLERK